MTTIKRLFLPSGPSAIGGFVHSVVVDALQCVRGGRSRSHIAKEVRKGFTPPLAYDNPPASVVLVRTRAGVCASLLHRSPHVVLRHFAVPRSRLGSGARFVAAPATGGVPIPKRARTSCRLAAAVAATEPHPMLRRGGAFRDYGQTTKALANQIKECRHGHIVPPTTGVG